MNKCILCDEYYEGQGNNAQPVFEGKCCDKCNNGVVVPVKMGFVRVEAARRFPERWKMYKENARIYIRGEIGSDMRGNFIKTNNIK